jgi:hypothetical protein
MWNIPSVYVCERVQEVELTKVISQNSPARLRAQAAAALIKQMDADILKCLQ